MVGSRRALFVLFLLLAAFPAAAERPDGSAAPSGLPHPKLLSTADGFLAGGAFASFAGTELLLHFQDRPIPSDLDRRAVNGLDALAIFPYDVTGDTISTVGEVISAGAPVLLAIGTSSGDWVDTAVMYAEAAGFAYTLKNIFKLTVTRYRPYLYSADYPQELVTNGSDFADSFPSGHATAAFAGATFLTYMFSFYHPDSPWIIPISVGSFGVATTTAVLRVTSGNHFVTDVLAGAGIGALAGFLVPYLHTRPVRGEKMAGKYGAELSAYLCPGMIRVELRL